MTTLQEALAAYTAHIRSVADYSPAQDLVPSAMVPPFPDTAKQKEAVLAICDEIDALAMRPGASLSDFQVLRHRLFDDWGASAPLRLEQAVGMAFFEQNEGAVRE